MVNTRGSTPARTARSSITEPVSCPLVPDAFVEVWCRADITVCEARDVKGLYRKARAGEITDFTGISSPYETPQAAELELDTGTLPLGESVARLRATLTARGIL